MSDQNYISNLQEKILHKFVSRLIKQSPSNANKIFNRVCKRKKVSQKCLIKSMQKKKLLSNAIEMKICEKSMKKKFIQKT